MAEEACQKAPCFWESYAVLAKVLYFKRVQNLVAADAVFVQKLVATAEKAAALAPRNTSIILDLAEARGLAEPHHAQKLMQAAFDEVIRLEPSNGNLRLRKAGFENSDVNIVANPEFKKGLELGASAVLSRIIRGTWHAARNNTAEALKLALEVASDDLDNANNSLNVVAFAKRLKQLDKAQFVLTYWTTHYPNHPYTCQMNCLVRLASNKPEDKQELLLWAERGASAAAYDPNMKVWLAAANSKLGRYQKALDVLEAVPKQLRGCDDWYTAKAITCAMMGKLDEATRVLEAYVKIKPTEAASENVTFVRNFIAARTKK